ncbi:uncharacterized protein L3040_001309 [Drepanopeziza brunnea f. sp. 'multigermtubi']|uniref:uncharacterized protein n=1 Tax=Drepanopeziza brunnea f. sp. 'multigermtubi' TaxID=698441 RepID=UPI00239DA26B|nr:hypothetical protein L3040_001309 [Drepanopeziza brunnea f. sp. 'multigermtubi']
MLLSKSTSLLLALSFLFIRAQGFDESLLNREVIGYRTASKEEAEKINENHKPYRDKRFDEGRRLNQLGSGFYMTPDPAGWEGDMDKENWYCVITADSDKIKDARKIYIPEYYEETSHEEIEEKMLWHEGEEVIVEYIRKFLPDPEKVLRFSYISLYEEDTQMLIPTDMLNSDVLDLWSQCYATEAELLAYSREVIDWKKWDVAGDPGIPVLWG